MFQDLLKTWFEWSRDMGYTGVFLMMALESTIVPIPSEIIMPPAGYWAAQGKMSLWGVILTGGLGSTFGSALCYWFSRTLGRTVLERYGKWLLLPPELRWVAPRGICAISARGREDDDIRGWQGCLNEATGLDGSIGNICGRVVDPTLPSTTDLRRSARSS